MPTIEDKREQLWRVHQEAEEAFANRDFRKSWQLQEESFLMLKPFYRTRRLFRGLAAGLGKLFNESPSTWDPVIRQSSYNANFEEKSNE